MTAPDRIAGMTLAEWREFARLDNCLEIMVPSELRLLIAAIPEPRATPAVTQPAPDAAAIRKAAAKTLLDMLYKRNGAHEGMTREYAKKLWDAAKDRNGYAAVEAFLATLITEKPHDRA